VSQQPIIILQKRRANVLRRAETCAKALDRLIGHREYLNVRNRYRNYLQTVANLTLAIDTLRQAEGKEVRALGQ
jgi:hypothetical protein